MPAAETILRRPKNEDYIADAVHHLCTDLQIGGVILSHELEITRSEDLFDLLAKGIPGEYTPPRVDNIQYFENEIGWHVATVSTFPALRMWYHVRGNARFSVARALPGQRSGFFVYGIEEVVSNSFASPAIFIPAPGDMLVFVDHGMPEVTGTSSFHRVDVMHGSGQEKRLSITRDLSLSEK